MLPQKLNARYVDARNDRLRPVMIHHAVLGSIERFIAMLLEHYEGRLPLWLAPDQVVVASVTAASAGYAREVCGALSAAGFRVVADVREERVARKAAEARDAGIPVFIAVGEAEIRNNTVAVRRPDGKQDVMSLHAVVERLKPEALK